MVQTSLNVKSKEEISQKGLKATFCLPGLWANETGLGILILQTSCIVFNKSFPNLGVLTPEISQFCIAPNCKDYKQKTK